MLYIFILRDVNRCDPFPIPSNIYRQELDIMSPNLMELAFVLTEIQKFIQTHRGYIHSLWARKCLLLFVTLRKDQHRVIIIINFYPKGSGYNNKLGIRKIFILRLKFGNKLSQRRVLVKNFQIFKYIKKQMCLTYDKFRHFDRFIDCYTCFSSRNLNGTVKTFPRNCCGN